MKTLLAAHMLIVNQQQLKANAGVLIIKNTSVSNAKSLLDEVKLDIK